MLAPKKVKHRKWHRTDKIRGKAARKNALHFGSYGLKTLTAGWISSRQIEATRRVLTRYTQHGGKVWIRIFPDKPMTVKGAETPMGKGKGAVDHYVAVVQAGTILFEMDGISRAAAAEAIKLSGYKLPLKCKFISKETN